MWEKNKYYFVHHYYLAGISASTSAGPQAAAVVADLSETTFNTPDGDIM